MSYPINYPTPQGANVQIFNATGGTSGGSGFEQSISTWVKPQGASFVWFTLIGAGGGGDNATVGGGAGAVTNFMCPAFLIPDSLRIMTGKGGVAGGSSGAPSQVIYQQKDGTGYTLLTAAYGSNGSSGGAAMTANFFTAMGFFQSVAGQGGSGGVQSASATTFLSGGGASGATVGNYGYSAPCGYFQMKPIIVGVGGGGSGALVGQGGIGCGGGFNGGNGGPGMAVIITW